MLEDGAAASPAPRQFDLGRVIPAPVAAVAGKKTSILCSFPSPTSLRTSRKTASPWRRLCCRRRLSTCPPTPPSSSCDFFFMVCRLTPWNFFTRFTGRRSPLYRLNTAWLFQEGFQISREPVFERLKRISDIVLSALGLLLAIPFVAAALAAIWIEDRGPVLFLQNRVGKNGVIFRLIKLRTMRADAAEGDLYTQPGDVRVTRVGRFLRASRLDELPQLWNVLTGDMSLIGPRAE